MSVRAKFRCVEIFHDENASRVRLVPVTTGSDENTSFYKWTPGGEITLQVIKRSTAEVFEPGQEYFVDFIAAPMPAAAPLPKSPTVNPGT
jgi:hypothetical protein